MRIAELPVGERPRERLAALGVGALADRELLAVLLGTGGGGLGAHQLAERMLARFGSLGGVARARPADLAALPGIGAAKAATLAAAFELGRRSGGELPTAIRGGADVAAAVAPLLRGRDRERLVAVICDRANRIRHREVISEGAADRSLVPVREVIVAVLRHDGAAFALAHNHPSGDPTPSDADRAVTARVAQAAAAVSLRFLDHLILTDTTWRRIPQT